MSAPLVPVSWGEVLDKITILEIKADRLRDPAALANVRHELSLLRAACGDVRPPAAMLAGLRGVNLRLWCIEDRIRAHERAGDFGPGFVALARAVYHQNDERGRIKRALNQALGSALVEEKQYSVY